MAGSDSIAHDSYVFLYPLVLMEITRKQSTNADPAKGDQQAYGVGRANSFTHHRELPPVDYKGVVRLNFDTLYSEAWLDLTEQPLVIQVPDAGERFYMLQLMDMWTSTFEVIGTRTNNGKAGAYIICAPGCHVPLPAGGDVTVIEAPTPRVWILGRTELYNQTTDYDAVHAFQDSLSITPLVYKGSAPPAPRYTFDPSLSTTAPVEQVEALSAEAFFTQATALMCSYSPHTGTPGDSSTMSRMATIGIWPCNNFQFSALTPVVQQQLQAIAAQGKHQFQTPKRIVHGWHMDIDDVGTWGTDYEKRAVYCAGALGVNCPEDAIYPYLLDEKTGKGLDGSYSYTLHFDKQPPVNAFWSLTLYDEEGFPVQNPINRYVIRGNDQLHYESDGSFVIHVSTTGDVDDPNWLPSTADKFMLVLRMYLPDSTVIGGTWVPPAVKVLTSHWRKRHEAFLTVLAANRFKQLGNGKGKN
eukprot:TRINITY_DN2494_c0_g1_i7.p1 TRINITY_DN2494_c0_g1~~TRINITY_DN2494_c0_g1_i7.p1  ORF type:complete len:493 (-),score=133.43 TRINITY_DN2494_c0_g1_i7:29-1435(-)